MERQIREIGKRKLKQNNMSKQRILSIIACAIAAVSCMQHVGTVESEQIYTAKVECEAEQGTRVYDADLNWSWQAGDALRAYQVAGRNIRNVLSYAENAANFVCEAFQYMSTDPESFHFIYPAAAEVAPGTLVAVQDGVWRPLSVTTVENATIEALPQISFEVLTAALELRVYAEDKVTPVNVVGAKLSAATDWVGKWTLDPATMTYEQGFEGTDVAVSGLDSSVVVFNMPDYPEGVDAGFFTLVLFDAEGGKMTKALPAVSFVKGKRSIINLVYTPDPTEGGEGGEGGDDPDTPDTPVTPEPEEPEQITGTFTCATYNVDGLPSIINSDGPGDDGTANIGNKIAASGWDIITFQENFAYSSSLKAPLNSVYTLGKDRGNISYGSAIIGRVTDTDGLLFGTLNATCSFSGETWEAFNDAYGGLTDGANTLLKKGIRHYVVTLKADSNVVIDLLVTHMNSGSDAGHITAREGQLAQIAAYINKIRSNNRPIVLMGDTNCRYTRDDMFQYLFNKIDSDLTYADPWVEHSWNGVYPTLGTASLMVPSKDAASTLTEQTGEVVDKIIYFNNPNAKVQIKSDWYNNDTDYAGMADHKPVVSQFTYTYSAK